MVNSTKHLRKIIPILLKLFQTVEEEGIYPNLFYEDSITLISMLDIEKLQASILDEYRYNNSQKMIPNYVQHGIRDSSQSN